jgi:hypothetical protein
VTSWTVGTPVKVAVQSAATRVHDAVSSATNTHNVKESDTSHKLDCDGWCWLLLVKGRYADGQFSPGTIWVSHYVSEFLLPDSKLLTVDRMETRSREKKKRRLLWCQKMNRFLTGVGRVSDCSDVITRSFQNWRTAVHHLTYDSSVGLFVNRSEAATNWLSSC